MRDYGKVHTTFWSSTTIREMSEDARTLAFYLLTSPHGNIAGVFRLPDGYACEDLKWPVERVAEGFRELFENGFSNRCETTKWVWVTKHFEWNKPDNPNQRKAAAKVANSIPDECTWKPDFMRVWAEFLEIKWAARANPSGTVTEPFANQEQEQEQEQKKERSRSKTGAKAPTPEDLFPEVDPDHLRDWVKARKVKRLPLTATAAKGFRREAEKSGMTVPDAVKLCAERGWAGLNSNWNTTPKPQGGSEYPGVTGVVL